MDVKKAVGIGFGEIHVRTGLRCTDGRMPSDPMAGDTVRIRKRIPVNPAGSEPSAAYRSG